MPGSVLAIEGPICGEKLILLKILEHLGNVLMARVGSRVDWDAMMHFDDLAAGRFSGIIR